MDGFRHFTIALPGALRLLAVFVLAVSSANVAAAKAGKNGFLCPIFRQDKELIARREMIAPRQAVNFYLEKYVRTELGADAQEAWRLMGPDGLGNSQAEERAISAHIKKNYGKIDSEEENDLREEISLDLRYMHAVRKIIEDLESIKIDLKSVRFVYEKTSPKPRQNSKKYYLSMIDGFYRHYFGQYDGPNREEWAAVAAYSAMYRQKDLDDGLVMGPNCLWWNNELHLRRKLYLLEHGPVNSSEVKMLSRGRVSSAHSNYSAAEFFNDVVRKNKQYWILRYDIWKGASGVR